MSRKPPIKNYEYKMEWMMINQKFKCSGCDYDFWYNLMHFKPHFAHYLARTDDNLKNFH
jgi:hypothetical protein